jgi:tetratricopeptide (TPR) repeat protein
MSLLMDALRKAEEAKRQAAQKQHEDKQQETPISISEPSAVDNLQSLEESLELDRELTSEMGVPEESAGGLADVDVPFDFDIDENFGVDEAESLGATSGDLPSDNEPDSESKANDFDVDAAAIVDTLDSADAIEEDSSVEDLDYIKPDELSRFTATSKSSIIALDEGKTLDPDIPVSAVDTEDELIVDPAASSLGLTLEERAPNIERPSIIGDSLEIPAEPSATKTLESPADETPEVGAEPIRAVRNDDTEKDTEVTSSADATPKLAKTVTPKFAEESRKRESARAVFNAKHKNIGKGADTRKKLIAAAAVIALFPLAGGGYLLLESMGVFSSGNQYNIPPSYNANVGDFVEPVETETIQESELPDISQEPLLASDVEQELVVSEYIAPVEETEIAPVPEPEIATNLDAVPVLQEPIAPELAQQSESPTESAAEPMPAQEAAIAMAEAEDSPPAAINITRTDNAERIDPQLTQAYASYRGNDFIGARARYQQVLRDKPNNRDAMLGLAAVAMQLGDSTLARETYVRLLELDPRDVHARVGLLETMPASDPVMLESELRALFAAHPEVAQLAFALGNHFASQRRWSDAQQSYYDALLAAKAGGSGPISPDYAFNLAVSLERLNQLRPAYTFYREALEQTELVTPGFDIRVLRDRLDAIERALP